MKHWIGLCAALLLAPLPVLPSDRGLDTSRPPAALDIPAERRVALVIGNADYDLWAPLANPVNDARAMADTLGRFGFEVIRLENATRLQMVQALREFGGGLADGGVGLFYYAGHGTQAHGENFMIPVDADIEDEDDIRPAGISVQDVFSRFQRSDNRLNLMILDACRSFPVRRGTRSPLQGLARMSSPSGTLIAYATAPNDVAKDGGGKHSPYTQALLDTINRHPGLKVEDVFKAVGAQVRSATEGRQQPWIESSIEGDFFFDPRKAAPATVVVKLPPRSERPAAPPPDPRRELVKLGISWSNQGFGDALMNSDLQALELFFAAGWNPLSLYGEEGNALAHYLWLAGPMDAQQAKRVLRLFVDAGVDPKAPVVRFRRLDPMDFASAAAVACNAGALEAALQSGADKQAAIATVRAQRGISPPPDGVVDCPAQIGRIGELLGLNFNCRGTAWDRTAVWCDVL
ncbi:caspase family protein [Pseudothauera nasutitermitis]|nr:caspase family protein [Pseudothauera nasutitermitis]